MTKKDVQSVFLISGFFVFLSLYTWFSEIGSIDRMRGTYGSFFNYYVVYEYLSLITYISLSVVVTILSFSRFSLKKEVDFKKVIIACFVVMLILNLTYQFIRTLRLL